MKNSMAKKNKTKTLVNYTSKKNLIPVLEKSRKLLKKYYNSTHLSDKFPSNLNVHEKIISSKNNTHRGYGLKITYGFHPSPFGVFLIGITEKKICYLGFSIDGNVVETLKDMKAIWKGASFREDNTRTFSIAKKIFSVKKKNPQDKLNIYIEGTKFMLEVWKTLLKIPQGFLLSYQDIANLIGKPSSVRAVASTIGKNPISFIIPCHRVISKTGEIHNYKWGKEKKRVMIGWERALQETIDIRDWQ